MRIQAAQLCFLATLLPHNVELPDNTAGKLLFNKANRAQCKITRQKKAAADTVVGRSNPLSR